MSDVFLFPPSSGFGYTRVFSVCFALLSDLRLVLLWAFMRGTYFFFFPSFRNFPLFLTGVSSRPPMPLRLFLLREGGGAVALWRRMAAGGIIVARGLSM